MKTDKEFLNELSIETTNLISFEKISSNAAIQKSVYHELRKQLVRVKNIEKTLEKKQKTKCKHCGRFTPVKITMSDGKWMGFDIVT